MRWREGLVIAVAALASIATSKKRWFADADVPAAGIRGPVVLVVESTRRADLVVADQTERAPIEAPAQYPGTSRFLVPKDIAVATVRMHGDHCKGTCGNDCSVPEGEYVRIAKVVPIATWTLTVTGTTRTDKLGAGVYNAHRLDMVASEPTVTVTVESTLRPYQIGRNDVQWPSITQDTEVTWTPRIVMEGACPDERPCEPPPTAKLELRGIRKL